MSHLRLGLIGCGSIALSAHVPALAQLTAIAQLEGVCDIRGDVAEATARRLGVEFWTTDYHALLAIPKLDAVIITTPEFLHAEQTVAAAQAGLHVLCEKPMATSLAEADAMLAAAKAARIHFMVAHSRRFTARYQTVRRLLDDGAIGDVVLVRENERRPRAQYSVLQLPVDIWEPETGSGAWKDLARYSGGVTRGHAIHEMDLFRWYAGAEAQVVRAEHKITVPGREVADAIAIQVRFANGVVGGCDLYSQAPTGYPSYHELELIGTEGMLRARDTEMLTLQRFDAQGMHFPTAYSTLLHITDAYVTEQRLFFESIMTDQPVPLDPWEARAALEMALAATESAETGRPVILRSAEPAGKETAWTA